MLAKDIMTQPCITVSADASVAEIAATLLKHHISAVPVVGNDGGILGIVSEGDLVCRVETGTDAKHRSWWLRMLTAPDMLAAEYVKSHGKKACDIMTSPAVTIRENTTVAEVARLLEERRIKRVPVTRGSKIVGIVSRANLVQCIASTKPLELPSPSDSAIRQRLASTLLAQPWASATESNIIVNKGVVELWGVAGSEQEKKATRVAAEGIPGVVQVVDHRALKVQIPMGT